MSIIPPTPIARHETLCESLFLYGLPWKKDSQEEGVSMAFHGRSLGAPGIKWA